MKLLFATTNDVRVIRNEADAIEAFGAGSLGACMVEAARKPAAIRESHPVYGLAALTEEEREEFSRAVDDAMNGDDAAVERILELANQP